MIEHGCHNRRYIQVCCNNTGMLLCMLPSRISFLFLKLNNKYTRLLDISGSGIHREIDSPGKIFFGWPWIIFGKMNTTEYNIYCKLYADSKYEQEFIDEMLRRTPDFT